MKENYSLKSEHRRYCCIVSWIFILIFAGFSAAAVLPQSSHGTNNAPPQSEDEDQQRFPQLEEHVTVEAWIESIPEASSSWMKIPLDLQSIPASVGVVPRSLFEAQAGYVLGEAIKNVSGVNVASANGVADNFYIRGFDSLETGLIMTDGVFEPRTTFYQLYNVEQVEVLKGPSAFLHGINAVSGTINLVRKQPQFNNFQHFRFSYGSFNSLEGSADLNFASSGGRIRFRLNALLKGSEFYRDDKDNQLFAVNPSVSFQLNDRTSLSAQFEYLENEYQPDSGLPLVNNEIPNVPRTRSYQSPFDFSDQQIYRFQVNLTSEINSRVVFQNKFYLTDFAWQSDGTLLNGTFPDFEGGLDVYRTLTMLDDKQVVLGNQSETIFSFTTGNIQHRLLTGFEIRRLTDRFTLDAAALPPIDLNNPVETSRRPLYKIPGQSLSADSRTINLAPYVIDYFDFTDRAQVFLGGRWDILDYEDPITSTSRNDKPFSPLLGGTFSIRPDLALYANYGKAYSPPSSRVAGEREPEEGQQFEIGAKKDLTDGKGFLSAAVYQLNRDNIAIPTEDGFTAQSGNQRSRGLELEFALEATSRWFTFCSYAYNISTLIEFKDLVFTGSDPPFLVIDRSGNRAPFAPEHILNFWTNKDLTNEFGVGGGVRYLSGQFIAPDNQFEISDYLILDATTYYRKGSWKFSLHLKNLTDQKYENRGFGNTAVIPADPFSISARIELHFER